MRQGLNAKEMARTLASSTVALTTGGMIVYECVAMGVPTVVYPQEQNLVGECAWFESRGCVVSLGHEGGCIAANVEEAVAGLLDHDDKLDCLSAAGRATLDGRGMHRAAEAIDRLAQLAVRARHRK